MYAEEAYRRLPDTNAQTMDLLNQASNRHLQQAQSLAEEQAQGIRDQYGAIQKGIETGVGQYDKSYARAYGQKRDELAEQRAARQEKSQAEEHAAAMEEAQRTNRIAKSREEYGNALTAAGIPRWQQQAEEDRARQIEKEKLDASVARSNMNLNQQQARLALEQAQQAKESNLREKAATDMAAAASQLANAQTAMTAIPEGPQGDVARRQAQVQIDAASKQLAQVQAAYREKGLSDTAIQAAQNQAAEAAKGKQNAAAEVWRLHGEGQGYEEAKNAIGKKIDAYRSLVSEANKYREGAALGADTDVAAQNVKTIMASIGKGAEGEMATSGVSLLPAALGGRPGVTGNQAMSNAVQGVDAEISNDIANLKKRYGAAPPPAVVSEIRGLEAAQQQIRGIDSYGRPDTLPPQPRALPQAGAVSVSTNGIAVSPSRQYQRTPITRPSAP